MGSTGVSFSQDLTSIIIAWIVINVIRPHYLNFIKQIRTVFHKKKVVYFTQIKEYIPKKSDDCSICNLGRMAIVEMDREKSLVTAVGGR